MAKLPRDWRWPVNAVAKDAGIWPSFPDHRGPTKSEWLYEPEERVYIGEQCPQFYDTSRVVSRVQLTGGLFPAFQGQPIDLNPGLIAIIGPKGSGKSALADLLAYSGGALSCQR